MSKTLKLSLIVLGLLTILLFQMVCIMSSTSYTNQRVAYLEVKTSESISQLSKEVDSLQNLIQQKRDTIIIQTIPQQIKIYYPKCYNSCAY